MIVDGRSTQLTRSLGLPDTPENRIHARQIADLVGASIRAGRSLAEIYSALGGRRRAREERLLPRPAGVLTVEKAYDRWLEDLPPNRRRSLEHDYKRHFRGYAATLDRGSNRGGVVHPDKALRQVDRTRSRGDAGR